MEYRRIMQYNGGPRDTFRCLSPVIRQGRCVLRIFSIYPRDSKGKIKTPRGAVKRIAEKQVRR